jgi:hypothetical protein
MISKKSHMQKKTLDDVSSRSSRFKQHSKDAVGVLEEAICKKDIR